MFKTIYLKKRAIAAVGVLLALACGAYMGYSSYARIHMCREKDVATNIAEISKSIPDEKVVYLTFDDGPSGVTAAILDILKENGVNASFFVMADENNAEYLPLLTRCKDEGNAVALHSCSHKYSEIYKSSSSFWADIDALRQQIKPYAGEVPNIFRFPGGSTNTVSHRYGGSGIMKTLMREATEKGYIYVDWNVCANDAVGGHKSADEIYRAVTKGAKNLNKCVVLFHDTKQTKTTVAALKPIIEYFKDNGYRFDTVYNFKK